MPCVESERDKITDAVEACLMLAVGKQEPFKQVIAYLQSLTVQGWTEADVTEVQVLITMALLEHGALRTDCGRRR
jgi:hypothetical protein